MMPEINIIIMGKTGAGKSTIVNAIMEEDVAPTGKGRPVTKENKFFSRKKVIREQTYTINICDTVGLEINSEITRKTISEIKANIKQYNYSDRTKQLSVVWFCASQGSSRFEPFEVDLIRQLAYENEVPFVVVITQCFLDEFGELEKQIKHSLPEITVCRTLAKPYLMRGGSVPAFGIDDLLSVSIFRNNELRCNVLEAKLKMLEDGLSAKSRKASQNIESLKASIDRCIERYAKSAGEIGWVPGGCIPIVHGKCITMISEINKLAGVKLTEPTDAIANAALGIVVTPFMVVPLLSSVVARAYVETVGEGYRDDLLSVIRSVTSQELNDMELITKRLKEEINKRSKQ